MSKRQRVVFVVDDEPAIAQTLAVILNQAGFAATAFDNPQRAIDAAIEKHPELLISDVIMPGMTGIDLAIHFVISCRSARSPLFSGQAATADLMNDARAKGYDFDLLAKTGAPSG
jgi:FixJ family two-component response regulator